MIVLRCATFLVKVAYFFFNILYKEVHNGKTVLVTGASRGLGSVIARTLVAKGFQVVII